MVKAGKELPPQPADELHRAHREPLKGPHEQRQLRVVFGKALMLLLQSLRAEDYQDYSLSLVLNEAETTAGMGRRWWPQLRAGARGRAGGRARTRAHACPRAHAHAPARTRMPPRARACPRAHAHAPARTRARLSLPNTSWSANRIGHETLDLGCWTFEAPIRLRPYLPAASASSGLWMPKLGFRYRIVVSSFPCPSTSCKSRAGAPDACACVA